MVRRMAGGRLKEGGGLEDFFWSFIDESKERGGMEILPDEIIICILNISQGSNLLQHIDTYRYILDNNSCTDTR